MTPYFKPFSVWWVIAGFVALQIFVAVVFATPLPMPFNSLTHARKPKA